MWECAIARDAPILASGPLAGGVAVPPWFGAGVNAGVSKAVAFAALAGVLVVEGVPVPVGDAVAVAGARAATCRAPIIVGGRRQRRR